MFSFTAATMVVTTGWRRTINRRLALVLALEGTLITAFGLAIPGILPDWSYIFPAVLIPGVLAAYLYFIATLETPLVAWLRGRWTRWLLLWSVPTPALLAHLTYGWVADATAIVFVGILVAAHAFTIVAAVSAWRRAPHDSAARRRAKAFVIAFCARDGYFVSLLVLLALVQTVLGSLDVFAWGWYFSIGLPSILIVYVALMTYGILRTRLFDIDLRIKQGMKASVLTACFILVFFAVSETIESIVATRAGAWLGLLAAIVVTFGLRPVERFATRLADRAMPGVQATTDYLGRRRLEVYRATLEGVYEDGEVSPRERLILDRLAKELGLTATEAGELEATLRTGRAIPG